jgi:hypothetical protein
MFDGLKAYWTAHNGGIGEGIVSAVIIAVAIWLWRQMKNRLKQFDAIAREMASPNEQIMFAALEHLASQDTDREALASPFLVKYAAMSDPEKVDIQRFIKRRKKERSIRALIRMCFVLVGLFAVGMFLYFAYQSTPKDVRVAIGFLCWTFFGCALMLIMWGISDPAETALYGDKKDPPYSFRAKFVMFFVIWFFVMAGAALLLNFVMPFSEKIGNAVDSGVKNTLPKSWQRHPTTAE